MHEISNFFGIVVYMFFNDYHPPHFKVTFEGYEADILIEDGSLFNGDLPVSKYKLVQAWADMHRDELMHIWETKDFRKVVPLSYIIKVVEILDVTRKYVDCRLSNGAMKRVFLRPIIDNHSHLNGMEKMYDRDYVKLVKLGKMGELYWPNTIVSSSGDVWNYNISPEYINHFGVDIEEDDT